jgi:single-strand DNA-binding protein
MINKVILVGNVGADPEIRTLESGVKVARIRLATTERVPNKDKSGYTDVTEWHSITLWRNLADVVDKYIRKGSQLYIEGKLRTREYDKNGVKCFSTEIVAEELKMLGRKESASTPSATVSPTVAPSRDNYPTPPIAPDSPDDLPF